MRSIDAETAVEYLRDNDRVEPDETVRVRELSGGVSNIVLLVERPARPNAGFVLKQARPQLRVPQAWYCSVERILREIDVMRFCQQLLECDADERRASTLDAFIVRVPRVLFEDRENYLFAMTAAPPHEVWKRQLLDRRVDGKVAQACGRSLAQLHGRTWRSENTAEQFGDREYFNDLRVDPYYRQVATVHDDLRPTIDKLIESLERNPLCLVHGDFSPKNLLVSDTSVMLIDFEVGHYGDPAFDLGFFLSHLVLKSFFAAPDFDAYVALIDNFWQHYTSALSQDVKQDELHDLTARAAQNLAACALARIDGKSKVEYLADESKREQVRRMCRQLLADEPAAWDDAMSIVRAHLKAL